jgi:type IV pilus assembly protein PilP
VSLRRIVSLVLLGAALSGAFAFAAPAAALEETGDEYNPVGRRDPFRPLALLREPAGVDVELLSPLQRYEVGQLKLVGVIVDVSPPRAMVEDSAGLGFILMPGTPIGPNGGVVTEIKPRQVVVEEWHTDVIGEKHRTELRLELPKDELDAAAP